MGVGDCPLVVVGVGDCLVVVVGVGDCPVVVVGVVVEVVRWLLWGLLCTEVVRWLLWGGLFGGCCVGSTPGLLFHFPLFLPHNI